MTELRIINDVQDSHFEGIVGPLSTFTEGKGFSYAPETITIGAFAGEKQVGGLQGAILWDWFYIKLLSLSEETRGHGTGRRILEKAEAIARERGCVGVWLDTYTFQSPEFYRALGYQSFGELPDHPRGHSRIFFRKMFSEG
ncbi:GNAT family N-acetyltransferase [Pseudovibrio exalbescens]|uniref:GNAT family N-acetyltransferase n=1 Tax=Pseudovibrio exalbescens TaxID=197461 RepID=UPI00236625AF|nr:GNAT family N-acetyltransferase [Pseudovibrio exalbescens]MDD7909283.1 GNAT family N-acetyltransferase [Pseudovibrio exalbescens]